MHLFRPWSAEHFLKVLPPTAKKIAVLDRTKEAGSLAEPLYLDVAATVAKDAVCECHHRSLMFELHVVATATLLLHRTSSDCSV